MAIFIIAVQAIIPMSWMQHWGFALAKEEIMVDEGLPNFFQVLKHTQGEYLIAENKCMKDIYGFETIESDVVRNLEQAPWPRVSIQGTPWYNILTNQRYAEQFGYISPCVMDRDYYIKDADDDDDNNGE